MDWKVDGSNEEKDKEDIEKEGKGGKVNGMKKIGDVIEGIKKVRRVLEGKEEVVKERKKNGEEKRII